MRKTLLIFTTLLLASIQMFGQFATILKSNEPVCLRNKNNSTDKESKTVGSQYSNEGITIYGYMTSSDNWEIVPGIYSFTTTSSMEVKPLYTNAEMFDDGGCVYINEKYYTINLYDKKLTVYDTNTWTKVGHSISISQDAVATDLTYDYTTETVYGCFNDEETGGYVFGTLDVETGIRTKIAELSQALLTIAASKEGKLYAIGMDLILYHVDKESGSLSKIGETGAEPLKWYKKQAMTFDINTNKLYWCFNHTNWKTYLYDVDITSGKANLIANFPLNENFVDIYIPAPVSEIGSPNEIDDLKVSFVKDSGNATVSFTIPTTTFEGEPFSGELKYSIRINNEELKSGTGRAGAQIEENITTKETGVAQLAVVLSNAQGKESKTTTDCFIGKDTPKAVENVVLKHKSGKTVVLTWDMPEIGIHNGYVDLENVTYKIVRYPSNTVCEEAYTNTTYQEDIAVGQMESIYYEVIPTHGNYTGEAAFSNRLTIGMNFEIPFTDSFDDKDRFMLYTVIDSDMDTHTWKHVETQDGMYVACDYNQEKPKDDWLLTPPITLVGGSKYVLSFDASSMFVSCPEKLEVAFGKQPEIAQMVNQIMSPTVIDNKVSGEWKSFSFTFNIEEMGNYYIGFHALSDADMQKLAIDNIRLDGALLSAPDEVSNLTASPDMNGKLEATVSFITPDKTVNGDKLSLLDKVEIYCNYELVKTIDSPLVNQTIEERVATKFGYNDISVISYNTNGRSISSIIKVYTGEDVPGLTPVTVKNVDGKQVITWSLPKGLNGGYVNPSTISYAISRHTNEDPVVVAADLTECTFTDEYIASQQTVVNYIVQAANPQGYGAINVSNPIVVGGVPYDYPFIETFAYGYATHLLWGVLAYQGKGSWVLWNGKEEQQAKPYDDDKGAIYFMPVEIGDSCQIFSGNITMSNAQKPHLEFYYYNIPSANTVKVQINPDTNGWEDIYTIRMSESKPEGWTKVVVPLTDYKMAKIFQFAFMGIANDLTRVYIDKIAVRDLFENDLSVSLKTRKKVELNESYAVEATIQNVGETSAGSYRVEIYRDGTLIYSEKESTLNVDEQKVYSIVETATLGSADDYEYYASLVYDRDENSSNDMSKILKVVNHLPKYPVVEKLKGNIKDSQLQLTWETPAAYVVPEMETVTEDFESYEPFAIDEIGDWTLVDVDGEEGTYGLLPLSYPHREEAKSFQVFNAHAIGVTTPYEDSSWKARSGEQMMIAFIDKDLSNDDWIISPMLTGYPQTITFYVRTLAAIYGLETFEVLVSKNGLALKDFTPIFKGEAETTWTKVEVEIPNDCYYFAIRCTSVEQFAMVLDDITYVPGTGLPKEFTLTGYNVYCDNILIGQVAADITSYQGGLVDNEKHTFAVTAVYDKGESRYSNVITLANETSIEYLSENKPYVYANEESIIVKQAEGCLVNIYGVDGKILIKEKIESMSATITIASGVYFVKIDNQVFKVIVK